MLLTLAVCVAASSVAIARLESAAHGATAPAPAKRPNIVVILSDDARFDSLGRMPNVERLLALHGVTFRNMFVTTSECCPSRASILTGQYSHTNGVIQNFGPAGYMHFDQGSNLAVWLQSAGYDTALVGKYLNDYTYYGHHEIPAGWTDWRAIDSRPEERYYDYRLNENGRLVHYGIAPSDYSTDVLARKAIRFIRHARKPFFLYFAPVAPHLPAIPAPRDISTPLVLSKPRPNFAERDLSDKPWRRIYRRVLGPQAVHFLDRDIESRQLRALRDVDRRIGTLMKVLKRRHELDNTIVLYLSDNGFLWGEHRLGGKIWPYDESIRVPLVVRVPWVHRARTDHHLVLNIDLASTIAQLAGVKPGLRQDGRSLVPLLRGASPRWRSDFMEEYLGESMLADAGPPPFQAVRSKRWLYVEYGNGWRELYDMRRDPYELRNLARDPALAALRLQLARRIYRLAHS